MLRSEPSLYYIDNEFDEYAVMPSYNDVAEYYECSEADDNEDVILVEDRTPSEIVMREPLTRQPMINVGATFSFESGPCHLFDSAEVAGATAIQLFVSRPDNWPAVYLKPNVVSEFRRERTKREWPLENIFVHGHLHVNLASSIEATFNRCYRLLESEVRACEALGVKYYIFHPGSPQKKLTREVAIKQMAKALDRALAEAPTVTILIENMAGQGDVCGSSFEEITLLIANVERKNQIGVCLDTQHLWAAGYDLTNWSHVMQQFKDIVGLEYVRCIHLNDSEVNLGSKMDRHDRIGKGTIPLEALRAIISDPLLQDIPFILESIHSENEDCVTQNREDIMLVHELRDGLHPTSCWYNDSELTSSVASCYHSAKNSIPMTPSKSKSRGEPIDDLMNNILAPHTPEANVALAQEYDKAWMSLQSEMGLDYLLEKLNKLKMREESLPVKDPTMRKLRLGLTTSQLMTENREDALDKLDDTLRLRKDLSQEYYTPSYVIDLIHSLWGNDGIELDPASSSTANDVVKAKRFYSKTDDALTKSWKSETMYLNAPFDRGVCEQFAERFVAEFKAGHIKEALILLPNTQGQWQNPILELSTLMLAPRKRIKFWNRSNENIVTRYPTYMVYIGENVERVTNIFDSEFHVYNRYKKLRAKSPMNVEDVLEDASVTNYFFNELRNSKKEPYCLYKNEAGEEVAVPFWSSTAAEVDAVVQGCKSRVIVDSGAGITTISLNFYRRIMKGKDDKLNAWLWAGIRCANNKIAFPEGWTTITVSVGPSTTNIPVCVLENLPVDVLLGVDWLRASKAIIYWDELLLTFRGKLGSVAISAAVKPENTSSLSATMINPVKIPAYSEMFVEVKINDPFAYIPKDQSYNVEGNPRLRDEKGIMIGQGYTHIQNGKLNLLMSNWSDQDVWIPKNRVVATLSPEDSPIPVMYINPDDPNKPPPPEESLDEKAEKIENLMKAMNIELDKYDEKYHKQIIELLYKYRHVFSDKPGKCTLIQHAIETGDHPPILCQPYREPYKVKPIIQEIIKGMIDDGLIRPSKSPWAFPVVIVPKADGKWRFTVDYRKLNAIVPRDAFPLPRITEHLTALGEANFFTIFDLTSGFWQIGVREEDIEKTAFICSDGLYESTAMPMGLNNSPATFQRLMQRVIPANIRASHALVYLDDIIVFSKTFDEHLKHLDEILGLISNANLTIKPKKVTFGKQEVRYLGHRVTSEGSKPDPAKVAAISNMPVPRCVRDVRRFVNLCGYYRQYIRNFAKRAANLYRLTQDNAKFEFGPKEIEEFNDLKAALTSEPILRRPDWNLPFTLQTDASIHGLGAVLCQKNKNGEEYVIAYASRTLSPAEKPWGSHELEALAIIWGSEYFRPYLYGAKYYVETDALDVTWLRNTKKGGRIMRWGLRLAEFDFDIIHRKGTANANADAISRAPNPSNDAEDPDFTRATEKGQGEFYDDIPGVSTFVAVVDEPMDPVLPHVAEWIKEQESCTEIGAIIKLLRGIISRPSPTDSALIKNKYKRLQRKAQDCYLDLDGILKNKATLATGTRGLVDYETIVVPINKREALMTNFHGRGHVGINKMYRKMRERYYWPNIQNDVKRYVIGCRPCRERKDAQPRRQGLIKPFLHLNRRPWDTASMDIYGPLPKTKDGMTCALVIVDQLSKWPEVYPMPNKEAETIANVILKEFLPRFSMPRRILSDQENTFMEKGIAFLFELLNIKRPLSSTFHPQTNTSAERFHRFLGDAIYTNAGSDQRDWDAHLHTILFAYRTSVHPTTNETPYFLLFGTDPVLPEQFITGASNDDEMEVDENFGARKFVMMRSIFEEVRKKLYQKAESEMIDEDARQHKPTFLTAGRLVMVFHEESRVAGNSTKFQSRYSGPYRVVSISEDKKIVRLWHPQTGAEWVVNVDIVRSFDPWKGLCVLDEAEWTEWLAKATVEPIISELGKADSLDRSAVPLTAIVDRAREEAEMERLEALHRYTRISEMNFPKPTGIRGMFYAQDWYGSWVAYQDEVEFEILRFLDRRFNQVTGKWEWLAQWKGNWLPTWVSSDTIREGASTGIAVLWRAYEDRHPYKSHETSVVRIRGVRNRRR